jgi:Cdc6-like AAA superfamily ATPase
MKHIAKNEDLGPPGYSCFSFKEDDSFHSITLFLPSRLLQTLHDEQIAAEEAQKAQEDQDLRQARQADEAHLPTSYKSRSTLGSNDLDVSQETEALEEMAAAADGMAKTGEFVAVHDVLEPLKLVKDLKSRTPDREIHKRNELLYKALKPRGHLRAVAHPQIDLRGFEHMRTAFPHFSPVLDLIRDQFVFAELTGKPFAIPPILLGGDPGIGKTRFSQELAKALGTVMRRLPFDNGQTGSSLLGSDKNWANTTYGSVFEMVVLGEYANPVILLDEVDKASKRREGDSLASLHSLLEPVTSGCVRDISLDFEFNASRVIWIATANNLERIPQSLRSRFQEFWIEQPTGEQALQMSHVVAQEVHQEMNLPDFQPPGREVVHFIAHLSAREQIQALKRAYAAANAAGRSTLTLADIPEQVRQEALEIVGGEAPPTGWIH